MIDLFLHCLLQSLDIDGELFVRLVLKGVPSGSESATRFVQTVLFVLFSWSALVYEKTLAMYTDLQVFDCLIEATTLLS